MRFRFGSAVCLCILFAGLAINPAQSAFGQHEAGKTDGPSKYLFVTKRGTQTRTIQRIRKT